MARSHPPTIVACPVCSAWAEVSSRSMQWNTDGAVRCRELHGGGALDLTACPHMWAAIERAFPGRLSGQQGLGPR